MNFETLVNNGGLILGAKACIKKRNSFYVVQKLDSCRTFTTWAGAFFCWLMIEQDT